MPTQDPPRKSGAELPSAAELLAILQEESQRQAIRFDFLATHAQIFEVHHQLSHLAGSNDDWTQGYASLSLEELVPAIVQNHAKLKRYILQHKDRSDLFKKLYQSLTPPEDLSDSEALFVFGAASNARVERAIELYQNGVAPKIILSGNHPIYAATQESEAKRMSRIAIEGGVPAECLILEEESITVPDNVKRTLDRLEKLDWQPSSITLIATNFVLQRGAMDWYKFTPWEIEVKVVAAHPQSDRFTEDGWYEDEETIALVLNEYAKLVLESKIDLMRRDKEIPDA